MSDNNTTADSQPEETDPLVSENCPLADVERRKLLKMTLGAGLGVGLGASLTETALGATKKPKTPDKMRPQKGDRLVFISGDKKDQIVKPEDLSIGGPQMLTYPIDPTSQVVRNGSGLNMVLVIRLDPAQLSEETQTSAAEGVVAYSASCTHQACPVSMWKDEASTLYCSCHGSEYDPTDRAKVVAGPAKRRLAILPLTVENGELVVAAEFIGRVGVKRR